MTWKWKIGDPVDDSNGGTMDAMNWGHGSDDEDNDSDSQYYSSNNNYNFNIPSLSPEQKYKIWLSNKKDRYEHKLKEARKQTDDKYRIRYYLEAMKYAWEYFEESEKWGVTVDGMPDKKHLLSKEDVRWISQKHYDEFYRFHILSTDQTENPERFLKESGNGDVIRKNEEIREERSIEATRRMGFEHTRNLKKDYFEHIQKANDLVLENKSAKAIKEYQKAIEKHDKFFQSDYLNLEMKRNMPKKSLTSEAVDHIMIIYRKTHPLLTSNRTVERLTVRLSICLARTGMSV